MIAHAWLRFEREHGSADDLLQAFIKTEPVFSEAASYETARADPQLAAQVDVSPFHAAILSALAA